MKTPVEMRLEALHYAYQHVLNAVLSGSSITIDFEVETRNEAGPDGTDVPVKTGKIEFHVYVSPPSTPPSMDPA